MADSERFLKGLEMRRAVLGNEYVDATLAASDDFLMAFQHQVTEMAWGMPGKGRHWIARRSAC